jgi:hypothetical protein
MEAVSSARERPDILPPESNPCYGTYSLIRRTKSPRQGNISG